MRLSSECRALVLTALGLTLARPAVGQSPFSASEPAVPEKAGKVLRAYRVTTAVPTIDGTLDDEIWSFAQSIDDFVQNEPDNMAAPRDRTVMQIAYDDRRLYVAIRCYTSDVKTVTTGIGRRDSLPPSDLLRLSIDPRHDHLNAYVFETNPSGMQSDYLFYDDTRQSSDYDAVWEVKTHIDADSCTAEYSIPFSQMRFTAPPGEQAVWGLNLRRDVYSTGEFDRWVGTPRGAAGFVSRFGHLVFEQGIAPPRRLELLPVTLSRFEKSSDASSDFSAAGGLDARIGLGSATTLLATVNPDFGQVEQDPSVLNLSVFETFYPEKRPFFLEDSRTFVPPYNQMLLFHSRRIGRRPQRIALAADDTEISRPDTTTILGAAKVTGKVARWTYGGLTALTDEEVAKVEHDATDSQGRTVRVRDERRVEPRTMYSVGRIIRDVGKSSTIGGLATTVLRDGDANAFSAGSDYNLRWDKNRANWNGMVAGTHAPIVTDAGTDMRSGLGWVTNGSVQRKYWNANGHFDYFSRDFKNTDLGYLGTRPNKYAYNGNINIEQPDPHGIFRSYAAYANAGEVYNGDRVLLERRLFFGNSANFKDYSFVYLEGERFADAYDDLDTRGGPVIAVPRRWNVFAGYGSDSRKTWRIFTRNWYGRTAAGGRHGQFYQSLELKPAPQVQTSISSEYENSVDAAQWISNTDVTGDGVTEPIYGRLGRNVWSLTGRVTYAFSRDMTVEGYLQPFVAVGHYANIRQFSKAFSYQFDPAALTTNPDFNTKSVNTNVVFRWEYVKGSSLFVVWNSSRSDPSRPGAFSAWRDLRTAFGGDGTNVFMVKVNYWLGL